MTFADAMRELTLAHLKMAQADIQRVERNLQPLHYAFPYAEESHAYALLDLMSSGNVVAVRCVNY